MRRVFPILAVLAAALLLAIIALAVGSCGSSGSSSSSNSADDDVAPDDDASPDDDDDASPADDDDDTSPTSPLWIQGLTLTPNSGFAGDGLSINFAFTDVAPDVNGGTVELFVDGVSVETVTAQTSGGTTGFIGIAYTLPATEPAGNLTFSVTLTDTAKRVSNTLSGTYTSLGADTAPVIANLRFKPSPACNAANSPFDVIFDFTDSSGNIDGGEVEIVINNQFPPVQGQLTGGDATQGTIPIQLSFSTAVPDGTSVPFQVTMSNNRGLISNTLSGSLVFKASACTSK
jgi:hypothetical protein